MNQWGYACMSQFSVGEKVAQKILSVIGSGHLRSMISAVPLPSFSPKESGNICLGSGKLSFVLLRIGSITHPLKKSKKTADLLLRKMQISSFTLKCVDDFRELEVCIYLKVRAPTLSNVPNLLLQSPPDNCVLFLLCYLFLVMELMGQ